MVRVRDQLGPQNVVAMSHSYRLHTRSSCYAIMCHCNNWMMPPQALISSCVLSVIEIFKNVGRFLRCATLILLTPKKCMHAGYKAMAYILCKPLV